MADIEFSQEFVADLKQVHRSSKQDEILDRIDLLSVLPELGSRILADSIKVRFGIHVRKLVVDPFEVIYEHFPERDLVLIVRLLHQREVQ